MSMLAWRSGRRARKPILRLLPIIILAFLVSAVFGVASIFSSNVTSETLNEVLLKGTRCGWIRKAKSTPNRQLVALNPYLAEKAGKSLNYGMQCYTNETHIDGCNLYIKPRLPIVSERGIACPFGDNICKLENDNLRMDTGYLDSLEHFGVNTGPETRFQLRFVATCAPLKTKGYTRDRNDSNYGEVKQYLYGTVKNPKTVLNFTYEVPVRNAFFPGGNTTTLSIPRLEYQLGIKKHTATPDEKLLPGLNVWTPISALNLLNADVQVAFLSAPEIHYAMAVKDAWFSAQKSTSDITYQYDDKVKLSAFMQDEPASVMGCTQQYQYCNPHLPEGQRCEPLRGLSDPRTADNLRKIFTTEDHLNTIDWVDTVWTSMAYSMSSIPQFIGASALRARDALSNGFSGPLPDDQWQLESEHWMKGMLSSVQDAYVTGANGLPESIEDFRQPPIANDTVAQNICRNQKIVSNAYSSFNVLGLSLILIFGVFITVLDMGLEPTVAWWQRRKYTKQRSQDDSTHVNGKAHPLYGLLEWSQTNMLQLQRLAHEEAGYGEWSKCDGDVPVTVPGQTLASLDFVNMTHPQLERQRVTPTSAWSDSTSRPWGMRRNDTGLDTLIEEAQAEKGGKKLESGDVEVVVRTLTRSTTGSEERSQGASVQMMDSPMQAEGGKDWNRLK